MGSIALFIGIVIAIIALSIASAVKRGFELKELSERGRPAVGRVTGKRARHSKGGRRRRVQISFDHEASTHSRWIAATRTEYEEYTEGAEIPIVYLPEKPSNFATRELVNQARAARSLPPLP